MKTYQEEWQRERQSLNEVATKVAPLLGSEWSYKVDPEYDGRGVMIQGEGFKSLFINIPWNNKERFEICGSYRHVPNCCLPYNREKVKITVAQTKTPERIAQDIKKRLLPPYERVMTKAIEIKKAQDNYEAQKAEALNQIKEALGGDTNYRDGDDIVRRYEPFCITAKYKYDGIIKLEVDLPLGKALEILQSIK